MEPHGGLFTQETGFGYHVRGSNYHTVMAYPTARHNEWIPYFSADRFRFRGLPIGDPLNDNRRTLLENRFLVAMTGSEGSMHHAAALRLLSRESLPPRRATTWAREMRDQNLQHAMPFMPRC